MHRVLRLEDGLLIETNPARLAERSTLGPSAQVAPFSSVFFTLWAAKKSLQHLRRPYLPLSVTAASAGSSSALVQPDWWRSHEMHRFPSASALSPAAKPDSPVIVSARMPRAGPRGGSSTISRRRRLRLQGNSSVFLLGALYGAGIRQFDVASIPRSRMPRRSPALTCTSCTRSSRARRSAGVCRVRRASFAP